MRTRAEITQIAKQGAGDRQRAILEVLLDIREMLKDEADNAAICGHGATGLCMACVIQQDLLRAKG